MPWPEAIFDPALAHPDMLFGNAGCGGPDGTQLGAHPWRTTADLTTPASTKFDKQKLAKTERASLISVEAIATLGTVP